MNATKTPDENLLDAQLDFVLNAPQEQFVEYLAESGVDLANMNWKAKSAFDRALENHAKTEQAIKALASLNPVQQKVVAQNLRIRRSVLTAFREHRVDVASIPKHFLARLATELGQAADTLAKALVGPAPRTLVGQYKSDEKPDVSPRQVPFEQLLREAAMSEEEVSYLMRDGD